jgi:acetoin utilization protein AcuB
MQVQQIMTRHVVSVSMDDSLESVRNLFHTYKFHHVVVVDQCKVVGIVSDRDLLRNLSPFVGKPMERSLDSASLRKRAHQVMTRTVLTVSPETPSAEAAIMLINNDISCLPVTDEYGACVGIVTSRDLLRWAVGKLTENACAAKLREQAKSAA